MKNPLLPRRGMYLVTGLFLLLLSGTYKQTLAVALNQATATNTPGTIPSFTPTDTPPPVTNTPTNTPQPPTNTPTLTPLPATFTATNTPVPPTATPTQTQLPATDTPVNTPTDTAVPATDTPVPATATTAPTNTAVPATATNAPAPNNNSATNTPTATRTPTPTVTPTPLSEPTSLAQAIAQVISYPALFPGASTAPLEDFDVSKAQTVTVPVEITIAGETFTAQLMIDENGQTVLVIVQDGETHVYPIDTKSPLYKAARFLGLIPVSVDVTVNYEGKSYRAIMVLDPTTGQLYYLMAKITTAADGTIKYGVVLKLDVSNP